MSCRKARQLKWRFLDRTLDNATHAQLEAHLRVCIPCRHDYTLSAQALEALKKGVELSPELRKALERPRNPALRLAVGLALIALILVGSGWYLWQTKWFERVLSQRPAALAPTAASNPTSRPISEIKVPVNLSEQADLMPGIGGAPHDPEASPSDSNPQPAQTTENEPSPLPVHAQTGIASPPSPNPPAPQATPKAVDNTPKPNQAPARPARPSQRRANSRPPQASPTQRPPLPEGTIEVYDESGQLIKRDQLPAGGKR
ncbi:MAG: zf-HC2 domain-containing protein [Fimbriimonadales bacterium]